MTLIITFNKLIINIIIVIILSLISLKGFTQIFGAEQNPLSVKWRKINASGFQLIYPGELEKEAQRMANTLTAIYPYVGGSLNKRKATIPVLLQNRGVIANGFVQLAPKKSEFFSTPPQQFDSQDWLNNLAVHELRHVAQFDKFYNGKAHPFPEEIYLAWFGVSLPLWYVEGDAVGIETSLTKSGRGRQPSWIMPYRTSLLSEKKISYSKAYFGSQKDVTPGYYQLGYLMTSQIRSGSDGLLFDNILTDIKNRPFRPYPFSNSLKKFSGSRTHQWYLKTKEELKKKWTEQAQVTTTLYYQSLNKSTRFATNYHMPVRITKDGAILALKQSKSEPARFVLIDSLKNDKDLFGIGQQEQPWFSYSNQIIVWDEIRYDPRYRQRSYSVICRYDLKTRKITKLSSRSRLFSPSLSNDGKKIIAVQIDLANKCNLVEMDAGTGKILYTYGNPKNLILQTPSYDQLGETVTYISVSEAGKALWTTKKTSDAKKVIKETRQQLSKPIFIGPKIAFNAHYAGVDNIYSIDTVSGEISALTAAKYGAFNPAVFIDTSGKSSILFNNYLVNGYEIAETVIQPQAVGQNHFVYFGAKTEEQERFINKLDTESVFSNIPDSSYVSRPYGTFSHLFNVHSLTPVIEDEYNFGLQLRSTNLLSTFSSFAGANYHSDLKRFEYQAGFTLKSFYPVIQAVYSNRPKRTFYNQNKITRQGDWRENYLQLNASLPLTISALNHNYSFSASVGTSYTKRYMPENMPSNYITALKFPMEYGFTFNHSTRTAERDIAPKWAQILRFTYLHQPFDDQLNGELFAAESFFYFPGIAANHTVLVNFSYQKTSGIRKYDRQINAVYGYNIIIAKSPLKNTLLLNYRFPVAFPDIEIGPLAYIRNLRAGLFCHYENIGTETTLKEPKTYGFEFHSSMNLLRYEPVVDLGARFVFVNKIYNQNPIFELLLTYSF